ncbi:MAG: hypothetical protein WCE21_05290 [Candidatus Babeliales bacterium]
MNKKLFFILGCIICITALYKSPLHSARSSISLLNYTDDTIEASYSPPSGECDFDDKSSSAGCQFQTAPAGGGVSFNFAGTPTGAQEEYNSGVLTVRYHGKETEWKNPRPETTYQVSVQTNGSLIIEGNSPRANVHYNNAPGD